MMKGSQKVGAYAALIQGVLFVVLLLLFLVVLPSQGISSPNDLNNAAKAAAAAPILALISLIILLFSGTVVLVVLAVNDMLQAGAPYRTRLAVSAALVASALFLANAMVGIVGGMILGQTTDAALVGPANVAFSAISRGLLSGAVFAASGSALMWSWAALSTHGLPSSLAYLVLLAGLVGIVQIVVAPLQLVLFVVNAIWSLWLGSVLWRAPSTMATPIISKA